MKEMPPNTHPLDDPRFGLGVDEPVWYLAHPLAGDDKFTFKDNMQDVIAKMRLCFDEGFRVIAPYHTICLCLDDNNSEHRRIGLETDCRVVRALGRIILTGHCCSRGMHCELAAAHERLTDLGISDSDFGEYVIDLTEMDDDEARATLRGYKAEYGG